MRIRLGFGLIVAGAGILAGCYEPPPMRINGNLSVRGEELGNWELDPGICAGGFYKGIDVSSGDGERCVRFIDDPELGPIVVAFIPGTLDGFVFSEDDCDTFYVRLDRTVDQQDRLYNHGGEIELSCATEDGFIEGRVEFDGCW